MALPTTSNVRRPLSRGYGLRINDLYLRLSVTPDSPIERQSAPRQPQRIDTRENPEDIIDDEYATVFSRSDFTGGEGLDFAHDPNNTELDRTRYWDSKFIDVTPDRAGQIKSFKLTKSPISIYTGTGQSLSFAGKLYHTDGNTLVSTSDSLIDTPTFSSESVHAGEGATAVTSIVSVGGYIYAAVGDGVHRSTGDGTWTHYSDLTGVDKLFTAKGRLFGAVNNELYEVLSAATSTLTHSLVVGNTWTTCTPAGPFILFGADDGTVYSFAYSEQDLTTLLESRTELVNEYPTTIGFRAGVVLVGTAQETNTGAIGRLYFGIINQDGSLTLDLKREWGTLGTTINYSPYSITISRDYAYFGIDEGTESYTWRYDFASGGLFRHIGTEASGTITHVLLHEGRLVFDKDTDTYVEGDEYESSGYLISPLIDFFTSEEKIWTAVNLTVQSVPQGDRASLYYSTNSSDILDGDSGSWIRGKVVTGVNESGYTSLPNKSSRYISLKVLLESNTGTTTPTVSAFSIKAYPGPSDKRIRIPINVGDTVELPYHRRMRIPGYGEKVYGYLRDIQSGSVELELLKPYELMRGIIEEISDRIPVIGKRGSTTHVAYITFRGRPISATGNSESEWVIGVGRLGIIGIGGHGIVTG